MDSDLSIMSSFIVTIFFTLFWIINPQTKKGKFILKILFVISSVISFIIVYKSLDKRILFSNCPSLSFNSKPQYGGDSEQGDSAYATFYIKPAENKYAKNLKCNFYCFIKRDGKYNEIYKIINQHEIDEMYEEKILPFPFVFEQKVNDSIYFYLKINFTNGICCSQKPLIKIMRNNASLNCFDEVNNSEYNEIIKLVK